LVELCSKAQLPCDCRLRQHVEREEPAESFSFPKLHQPMTMASTTRISFLARRFLLGSTGGISAYGTYKANYDPLHLVWDLDNTILCSVTPLSTLTVHRNADDEPYDSFDQIDDDFPVENAATPNTRTYWRPGARTALSFCSLFAIQHVYTTAQGTYTANVLKELDPRRTLFHTVIHRDLAPASVKQGKDLSLIAKAILTTSNAAGQDPSSSWSSSSSSSSSLMNRLVLLDDRVHNFAPQKGQNGLHVFPFQVKKVPVKNNDNTNSIISNDSSTTMSIIQIDTIQEIREVARLAGISMLCFLATDVRWVLSYFQSPQHQQRFPRR
jgi:NLI interacting factor-like phosphatase